jgi:GNAT superfamily N-acetyltransferase
MSAFVSPVLSKKDMNMFIKLPWKLYKGDENWIPPLLDFEKKLLDRNVHPFHKHADVEYFLAKKDGDVVGRIAAIVNHAHNQFHNEKTGFFGFFESINDQETASALFDAAEKWLSARGMNVSRGPCNFSTNETCGLLVDGFKYPPFFMMTYNPPYYINLVQNHGYTKVMDLLAFYIPAKEVVKDKFEKVADQIKNRQQITIRHAKLAMFEKELAIIREIYNDAWSQNWGFVPMTDEEFHFMAKQLKPVVRPEFVLIAEYKKEPVGFGLALPNINPLIKKIDGKLFPFGWLVMLIGAKKIPYVRIITLGVKKQFQNLGVGTLLYLKFIENGIRLKQKAAELSWILETNVAIISPILAMKAKPYKVYRIYEKNIT